MSGFDIANLDTDPELEEEGAWSQLAEDAWIKVARVGNKKAEKEWQRIPSGQRRLAMKGSLPEKDQNQLWSRLLSRAIIRDWKNIEYNGKKLDCTEENAYWLCMQSRGFREFVYDLANDDELFKNNTVEEDVGNSKPASAGNSRTEE